MIIVGAGMAGLLAARMLRAYNPVVWEAQPTLPDNHGALLRFRTDAVARATGIPFRKVYVVKAVMAGGRLRRDRDLTPDLHNEYSLKVTGEARARSILNMEAADRYIAPDDFLARLADGANIRYSSPLHSVTERTPADEPMVSTIPMPALMGMAAWDPVPAFGVREVWSVTVELPDAVDLYQTVYYPGRQPYYRASITGRKMILEYTRDPYGDWRDDDADGGSPAGDVLQVFCDFGFERYLNPLDMSDPVVKRHAYGKILPLPEDVRHTFILAMTDRHAIYSLGRFATWRQLLLDDLVTDIGFIERVINQRSQYQRRLEAHFLRQY